MVAKVTRQQMKKVVSGAVAALVLLGPGGMLASKASPAQVAAGEPILVPVTLPDLGRMHEAVQEQLREAYTALQSLESGSDLDEPAADRRAARGEAYGELGKLLLAGDYPEAAEGYLQNARLLAPGDLRWPYYLAHVFIWKGDLQQAVEHFEEALRLNPSDFATLVWLAHVHVDLDQPEAAEPVLSKARALYPDGQAFLYEGGRAALAAQDYAEAVERLEAALRLNPTATAIHYPLAMAYRGLGDLEQARDHLDRRGDAAVAVPDPLMADLHAALRSPQVHRDLGVQASAREDWPEAVRQFRQAAEMAPRNSAMRVNLGTALIRTGDAGAALAALEEAVALDPRLATAHYLIGTLLEQSGRHQDAIDRYTAAVTHDPSLGAAHLRRADILRRTGQLEASLTTYRRVIDREEARFGEAMALVRLGRYQEARQRLSEAMERYPAEPAFPHALARLLAAAPDDQVRDGQRALELVQALAEEHRTTAVAETMAMALAELGRFAEAVEWQRFAMGIAADAALPKVARGMADNLTRYLQNEPCRTPWRDDEPEYNPGPPVDPALLEPPRS